ncbi:hypothetical protein [Embleya sp. NPDC001921]
MGRGWGWLGIAVGVAATLGLLATPTGSGGNAYGGAICASVLGGAHGDRPIVTLLGGVDKVDTKEAVRTALHDCERRRGNRLGWALAATTPTAALLGGLLATLPPRGRRAATPGYR